VEATAEGAFTLAALAGRGLALEQAPG